MYPPHHYGGYELSCRDVVERWRARGHEVLVLTSTLRVPGVPDDPGERARGVWRDLSIVYREGDLVGVPLWRRPSMQRADQRTLASAISAIRPDVVSLWHMAALSTGLITTLVRSGLPLVYNVCDDWLTYAARMDPWMRLFVDRRWLGRRVEQISGLPATVPDVGSSGTFCFVSQLTATRSEAHTAWTFPIQTIVYSGIDLEDFPAVEPAPEPWSWRLLYVGRLDPRKGIETAVRALTLLPDATLDIVGRGDEAYRRQLEHLAGRLGVADRLRFDVVERRELQDRYAAADAVVFPNVWDEPFGLVPIEAMASGTPVVATATGGSAEFLADGVNCLVFPAGSAVGLARAVRRLANDAELRATLVRQGTTTVNELNVDRLAEVLEEWHVATAEGFAHGMPQERPRAAAQPSYKSSSSGATPVRQS